MKAFFCLCFFGWLPWTAWAADSSDLDKDAIAMNRYRSALEQLRSGGVESGREALTRLVDDLPYTEGARRAFVLARGLYRQRGGADDEADFLLGVASRLAWVAEPGACSHAISARSLLALALIEVGRIRLDDNSAPDRAVRILQRALPVARSTPFEDDALIWLARSLHQAGRPAEALSVYQDLIAVQHLNAGAAPESPFYDDALFEMGQLLEAQQRFMEAQIAYTELFQRLPTSELIDAASQRLVQLQARQRALVENITGTRAAMHGDSVRNALH